MTTAGELASDFDPLAPGFVEDPHHALHELRQQCPVAYSDRWGGFYALTRRADVVAAAKQHRQFINSVLHIVPGGMAHNTRPLMHSDQPEHSHFKAAMLPVFNGPHGAEIAPSVRAYAEQLVAGLLARGEADLVRDYAG